MTDETSPRHLSLIESAVDIQGGCGSPHSAALLCLVVAPGRGIIPVSIHQRPALSGRPWAVKIAWPFSLLTVAVVIGVAGRLVVWPDRPWFAVLSR